MKIGRIGGSQQGPTGNGSDQSEAFVGPTLSRSTRSRGVDRARADRLHTLRSITRSGRASGLDCNVHYLNLSLIDTRQGITIFAGIHYYVQCGLCRRLVANDEPQVLEAESPPLGVPRLIGAKVPLLGVPLMLGADVPLSGSLMVTQGGDAAIGSA